VFYSRGDHALGEEREKVKWIALGCVASTKKSAFFSKEFAMNWWSSWWERLLFGILGFLGFIMLLTSGCARDQGIEKFATTFTETVIAPAVKKGISQGIRSLSMQAGAQGINPTYVIEFEGLWVTGVKGNARIGVEGLSGQVMVSTTGDEETETSPSALNPAVEDTPPTPVVPPGSEG